MNSVLEDSTVMTVKRMRRAAWNALLLLACAAIGSSGCNQVDGQVLADALNSVVSESIQQMGSFIGEFARSLLAAFLF